MPLNPLMFHFSWSRILYNWFLPAVLSKSQKNVLYFCFCRALRPFPGLFLSWFTLQLIHMLCTFYLQAEIVYLRISNFVCSFGTFSALLVSIIYPSVECTVLLIECQSVSKWFIILWSIGISRIKSWILEQRDTFREWGLRKFTVFEGHELAS